MRILLFTLGLLFACGSAADAMNYDRARFNYQMFCQGCHAPDGAGSANVPTMKGHVGNFLLTENGREYLVRVPGSATSSLNDDNLAEVLNWIVLEMGGESRQPDFRHYTAQEVAELRQKPLNEVEHYRVQLLAEIAALETGE